MTHTHVTAPTQFVEANGVRLAYRRFGREHIPDAQLIIYPDSGHASHFQYPDRFLTHARLFLDC
jgi:hypothetical protein